MQADLLVLAAESVEMLQAAGIGVAMGQGREEIKAIADYVTDSVDREGIVTALQAFGQL